MFKDQLQHTYQIEVTSNSRSHLNKALFQFVEKNNQKPLEQLYAKNPSIFDQFHVSTPGKLYRAITLPVKAFEAFRESKQIKKNGPFESWTTELSFAREFLDTYLNIGDYGVIVAKSFASEDVLIEVCDVLDFSKRTIDYCHENEYLTLATPHSWSDVLEFYRSDKETGKTIKLTSQDLKSLG